MTEQEALARLVPKCDQAPHRAVVWVQAEVHEVTKYGECSGMPKYRVERFPVSVDGADKNIAIRKLNEVLEGLKELCKAR